MTSSTTPATVEVVAPITGTIIDITDVPDPVLSKKSVGDGFGISAPPGGTVVSPVTGTVIMVAKTLRWALKPNLACNFSCTWALTPWN